MPWLYLFVAAFFEVGFTTCMKHSEGFSRPLWTAGFALCAVLSFVFLALATRVIPLGAAYAIWTGIGAAGTILVGRFVFADVLAPMQYACVALIVAGVVGLRLGERANPEGESGIRNQESGTRSALEGER